MKLITLVLLLILVINLTAMANRVHSQQKPHVETRPVEFMTHKFAGGNTQGNGFNATKAKLNSPKCVVSNEQGELFMGDGVYVKKITTDKRIQVIAGTGTDGYTDGGSEQLAVNAMVGLVQSLTLTRTGDLLVSEYSNHVIRRIEKGTGKISIVAGVPGSSGFNGDGFVNTTTLFTPVCIAEGLNSEIIIADNGNQRIRKVTVDGQLVTIAGNGNAGFSGDGGLATDAEMYYPTGLFIHTNGDIYFCDLYNHRIRMVNGSGIISTVVGSANSGYGGDGGLATDAQIRYPNSVVVAPDGTLYFTDGFNVIRMVNSSGYISTICGNGSPGFSGDNGPAISAQLSAPTGLFLDSNGNLYVSDSDNQRIRKISATSGMIETIAGSSDMYNGDGLVVSQALLEGSQDIAYFEGVTYIADKCKVRKIDQNQIVTTIAGNYVCLDVAIANEFPATQSLQYIYGIQVSPITKELFIALDVSIYKLTSNNTMVRVGGTQSSIGGDGFDAKYAVLSNPQKGVEFLPNGEMIIADSGNARIRKVSNSGIINTIAGTSEAGYSGENVRAIDSAIGNPNFLLVSKNGEIYIAEQQNRVRKISLEGNITTIAGNGIPGNSGDGGLATDASIGYTFGLALSIDEELLYIADTENNAVRIVNLTSGIISTMGITVSFPTSLLITNNGMNLLLLEGDTTSRLSNITLSTLEMVVIAGTGVAGYNGDEIPANTSMLNNPNGLSVAPNGDVYISDTGNARLRKVSNGIIYTIVGNGLLRDIENGPISNTTTIVPLNSKFSANGDLYLADRIFIRKISLTDGTIQTVVGGHGDGGLAINAILCPNKLTFASNGDLYFSDSCIANNVRKIAFDTGIISTVAGGIYDTDYNGDEIEAIKAKLKFPFALAMGPYGDLFITESQGNRIRRVSKDGIIHTLVGNGIDALNSLAVAAAPNGDVFYASCNGNLIGRVTVDGNVSIIIGTGSNENGNNVTGRETSVPCPIALSIDRDGGLMYASQNMGTVRKATPYCDHDGYHLSSDYFTCVPTCFGKYENSSCGGSSQGTCTSVNVCQCEQNWSGSQCEIASCFGKNGTSACSGNGNCTLPDQCTCNAGYTGAECQTSICFDMTGPSACSGKGNCTFPQKCECISGYTGLNCNVTTCFGVLSNDSSVCQSRGKCLLTDTCSCNVGYTGVNCESVICSGKLSNDSNVCSGHGNCTEPDSCTCSNGFTGSNCEHAICFGKLSNDSSNVCSGHGNCTEPDTCKCSNGYNGVNCETVYCYGKLSNDSNICSGYGNCTEPDSCKCSNGYNGVKCELLVCFGKLSNDLSNVCSGHGNCTAPDSCKCSNGFTGSNCQTTVKVEVSVNGLNSTRTLNNSPRSTPSSLFVVLSLVILSILSQFIY